MKIKLVGSILVEEFREVSIEEAVEILITTEALHKNLEVVITLKK